MEGMPSPTMPGAYSFGAHQQQQQLLFQRDRTPLQAEQPPPLSINTAASRPVSIMSLESAYYSAVDDPDQLSEGSDSDAEGANGAVGAGDRDINDELAALDILKQSVNSNLQLRPLSSSFVQSSNAMPAFTDDYDSRRTSQTSNYSGQTRLSFLDLDDASFFSPLTPNSPSFTPPLHSLSSSASPLFAPGPDSTPNMKTAALSKDRHFATPPSTAALPRSSRPNPEDSPFLFPSDFFDLLAGVGHLTASPQPSPLILDFRPASDFSLCRVRNSVNVSVPGLILSRCRKLGPGGLHSLETLRGFITNDESRDVWDALMQTSPDPLARPRWTGEIVMVDESTQSTSQAEVVGQQSESIPRVLEAALKSITHRPVWIVDGGMANLIHEPKMIMHLVRGELEDDTSDLWHPRIPVELPAISPIGALISPNTETKLWASFRPPASAPATMLVNNGQPRRPSLQVASDSRRPSVESRAGLFALKTDGAITSARKASMPILDQSDDDQEPDDEPSYKSTRQDTLQPTNIDSDATSRPSHFSAEHFSSKVFGKPVLNSITLPAPVRVLNDANSYFSPSSSAARMTSSPSSNAGPSQLVSLPPTSFGPNPYESLSTSPPKHPGPLSLSLSTTPPTPSSQTGSPRRTPPALGRLDTRSVDTLRPPSRPGARRQMSGLSQSSTLPVPVDEDDDGGDSPAPSSIQPRRFSTMPRRPKLSLQTASAVGGRPPSKAATIDTLRPASAHPLSYGASNGLPKLAPLQLPKSPHRPNLIITAVAPLVIKSEEAPLQNENADLAQSVHVPAPIPSPRFGSFGAKVDGSNKRSPLPQPLNLDKAKLEPHEDESLYPKSPATLRPPPLSSRSQKFFDNDDMDDRPPPPPSPHGRSFFPSSEGPPPPVPPLPNGMQRTNSTPRNERESEVNQPFNVSTILPNFLYLGPEIASAQQANELRSRGIRRVLNMAIELDDNLNLPMYGFDKYLKIGMRDSVEEDGVLRYIREVCKFLDDARLHSQPTFVHCKAGKSRSVTAVLAYLIHANHWPLAQAYSFVNERRSGISPNIGFVGELMKFEEEELGGKSLGVIPTAAPVLPANFGSTEVTYSEDAGDDNTSSSQNSSVGANTPRAPSHPAGIAAAGQQHSTSMQQMLITALSSSRKHGAHHIRESLPPMLPNMHTAALAAIQTPGEDLSDASDGSTVHDGSRNGSVTSDVVGDVLAHAQEVEVKDAEGRYRHARRAPKDEHTLQPLRRVSKAGLESSEWMALASSESVGSSSPLSVSPA